MILVDVVPYIPCIRTIVRPSAMILTGLFTWACVIGQKVKHLIGFIFFCATSSKICKKYSCRPKNKTCVFTI